MDELKRVELEDLIFENIPLKDRINTKLTLLDTDWMAYTLETSFRVKKQGELKIRFEYCGIYESNMHVTKKTGQTTHEYTYYFPSDIFEKHLLRFMHRHLEQWEKEEVFYGGDIVVEFYNEVISFTEKNTGIR